MIRSRPLKNIILIFSFLLFSSPVYSGKFYSIVGAGAGYRDFIQGEPEYHPVIISPYFEYGSGNFRRRLFGFSGMVVLNPENNSEITLFQISGQVKFFLLPKRFYIGGGPGLNIEGENAKRDDEPGNSGLTIEEPKLFPNITVHMGFAIYLFKGNNIIIDSFASQSLGKPFPYSFNLMIGILSLH